MELEMDVEDLLNKRKLESDRIEFKTGWNPDDIYHSVCAFANDYNNDGGGYIVVGVEEENGVAKRPVKGLPEYMLDGTVGDFTDFPKIYFYYGENECLYAFAGEFRKAMEKYHVPYEIIVGKGMCHCYPLARYFREGREAQDQIIELLKS